MGHGRSRAVHIIIHVIIVKYLRCMHDISSSLSTVAYLYLSLDAYAKVIRSCKSWFVGIIMCPSFRQNNTAGLLRTRSSV